MPTDLSRLKKLMENFMDSEAQKSIADHDAKSNVAETVGACEACNESPCVCEAKCGNCMEDTCVCEAHVAEEDIVPQLHHIIDQILANAARPLPKKYNLAIGYIKNAVAAINGDQSDIYLD